MGKITWPLEQNEIRGNSLHNTFGMVRNNGTKAHQGWDFKASVGTSAYAIADGKVEFVNDAGDYGKQVCISFSWKNKQTLYAFYAHLETILVVKGQLVMLNQRIATTGKSGNAQSLPESEDHLHFELRTKVNTGLGLSHHVSPIQIYHKCPLTAGQDGEQVIAF